MIPRNNHEKITKIPRTSHPIIMYPCLIRHIFARGSAGRLPAQREDVRGTYVALHHPPPCAPVSRRTEGGEVTKFAKAEGRFCREIGESVCSCSNGIIRRIVGLQMTI